MKTLTSLFCAKAVFLCSTAALAQSQEGAAIPGGDQFAAECAALIPGGDQFDPAAIPGGDQFDPKAIPGGDQFLKECLEKIPGGDQFDPEQIANGGGLGFDPADLKIDDELPEGIPGGDQFDPKAIPGGDQFDPAAIEQTMTGDRNIDDELPEGDGAPAPVPAGCNWTGSWGSTYGILRLVQNGAEVSGDYGVKGFIEGRVGAGCSLKGSFDNRKEELTGHFKFERDGDRFQGEWGLDGEPLSEGWKGRRSSKETPELRASELWAARCNWTGAWFTPWAGVRMKLVQQGKKIYGELGERETIEGTTQTECKGNRDVRLEATLKDRETNATRSMTITMSGRQYAGTIGGSAEGLPSANVMTGSRASLEAPVLTFANAPTPSPVYDGGGPVTPRDDRRKEIPEENATPVSDTGKKIARWAVNIGNLCVKGRRPAFSSVTGEVYGGIIWVRARVYDKTTGKEVELAPVGGFPNLYGDKERVWEVLPNGDGGGAYYGQCYGFAQNGLSDNTDPVTLKYEFDYEKYGYESLQELVDRRRNRIRVMYKLFTTKAGIGVRKIDKELGVKAKSYPLDSANFCGLCKKSDWEVSGSAPLGDGVFSGLRDENGEAVILYDIKRVD